MKIVELCMEALAVANRVEADERAFLMGQVAGILSIAFEAYKQGWSEERIEELLPAARRDRLIEAMRVFAETGVDPLQVDQEPPAS